MLVFACIKWQKKKKMFTREQGVNFFEQYVPKNLLILIMSILELPEQR